jgi:hypothetical protein
MQMILVRTPRVPIQSMHHDAGYEDWSKKMGGGMLNGQEKTSLWATTL